MQDLLLVIIRAESPRHSIFQREQEDPSISLSKCEDIKRWFAFRLKSYKPKEG